MYRSVIVRRALVALAASGAMIATGLGVSAASTLPAHIKKVSVSADHTHKKINATLPASGALTGKITVQGSGHAAADVSVSAFNPKGNLVGSGYTDMNGKYHVYGLDTGKYEVCVVNPPGPSASYTYGLSPACVGSNTPPTFFNAPKDAKKFSVRRGHPTTANLVLPKAGAISGTIRTASGKKLQNMDAEAYQGQQFIRGGQTDSHGGYTITGLRPGKYTVCFFAENNGSTTTNTKTGVLRGCWKNVAYPGSKVPSNADKVSVKAGKKHGGINAKLHTAGAIAGKVVSASNHKPLVSSSVEAFRGTTFYTSTFTDSKGNYTLKNLPAGNFKVCAIGGSESGSNSNINSSAGRCYLNKPMKHSRPSSGAKSVRVKIGKAHKNINFKLPTKKVLTGTITGTLTGPGGVGVSGAEVEAVGPGGSTTFTASDGTYTLNSVLAGKYDVCFDPGETAQPSTGTAPVTGYSKVCYKSAKWAGGSTPPAGGATKLTVRGNKTTSGIDAKVGDGGAISGSVKLAGGGHGFVVVEVLDSKGNQAAGTEADGAYKLSGLTPSSGYPVCFSAISVNSAPPNNLGYINQCYKNKTWHAPVYGEFSDVKGPRTEADLPLNHRTGQWPVRR